MLYERTAIPFVNSLPFSSLTDLGHSEFSICRIFVILSTFDGVLGLSMLMWAGELRRQTGMVAASEELNERDLQEVPLDVPVMAFTLTAK